jgi:Site-specific recombinases, DNA invertase Pin homologs
MTMSNHGLFSKKHTALYIRVSTDAQREEGYSIEAQKDMLEGYCKSRQIKNYEVYIDGGFSGSSIERPEVKRLIDNVKRGLIDSVIVYKLDRLSRSQKDTLFLIEDVFNPHNVSFVSLNENMDTSTPIGRAMLGIMSAFAQLERETIRERTRLGMRERVKSGLWMGGGHVPFGYDYDKDKGILVPNSDAETVKKMYDLYLQGYSMMKIAQTLGLKYERLAQQILMRKTNAGYIHYNGVDYKGLHEPIISEEKYNKVMDMISDRSRKNLTTAKSLLAGLIYCGVCGAKFRYQKWGKQDYKVYCYSQDKGKPHLTKNVQCDNIKVWANDVESVVISDLFKMARTIINDESDDTQSENIAGILERQYELTAKKIKNLYNLYAQNEDDLLLQTIEENQAELAKLSAQINSERQRGDEYEKSRTEYKRLLTLEDAWQFMTVQEKQNVLRSFIDKIIITYEKIDAHYKI